MMAYLNSGNNPDWQNSDPRQESNFIVLEHFNNLVPWHNEEEIGFFTGHREYLGGMEAYLLATPGCETFVPLPAFDPGSPNGIPDEFFADESVLDNFPIFTQVMNGGGLTNQFPNLPQLVINEETCNQQIINSSGNVVLDFSNIDDFANYVESGEGQHNDVHGAIGGIMANPNWSPATAIFWLWHAYVDDTYRCYQQLCQCENHEANYDDDNCEICFESYSTEVIGNNGQFSFFQNGSPVDNITLNDNGCLSMGELEVGADNGIIVAETGDICPQSLSVAVVQPSSVCACIPVETRIDECTVCFETLRTSDSADESVWTFTNVYGNEIDVKLDADGCILRGWQHNYPNPGGTFMLSIEGRICNEEQITFQMPMTPVGVDPKWGRSCIEAVIVPENPFKDQFSMEIENLGKSEEISIFRMDIFTGQREEILSPTRLNSGEKYRVKYDASRWQNGTHLIHVYYGDYLIADQVIKQE